MDPIIAPAIAAGGQLIGGLFGQWAQSQREKEQRKREATAQAYESQMKGAAAMGQGQATALGNLMEQYRAALARPPVL